MCSPIASPSSALDVQPNVSPEETLAAARITLQQQLHAPRSQRAGAGRRVRRHALQRGAEAGRRRPSRLITGVNLPMLLRAVTYRHEPLDALVRAPSSGGTAGRDAGGHHRTAEPGPPKP
jgi:PTS system mannose-specific IIA component